MKKNMSEEFIKTLLEGTTEEIDNICANVGVYVKDEDGNYRNTYDVLRDLAFLFL